MEPTIEWDENKKQANVRKHGIDFDDAKRVFSDPAAITFASTAEHDEPRFLTVGRVGRRGHNGGIHEAWQPDQDHLG